MANGKAASGSASMLQHWQMWLFLLFGYVQMILAMPIVDEVMTQLSAATDSSGTSKFAAQSIVIAVLMMLTGLLFCFFGYRWFRVALWLAGFYVFASIAYFVLVNFFDNNVISSAHRETVTIVTLLIAGIIGGFLALFLFRLGVFCLGATGFIFLALWILSWGDDGTITNKPGRYVFLICMAILGGCLALWQSRNVIIIGTGFAGAAVLFLGIDYFAQTGLAARVEVILGGDISGWKTNSNGAAIGMQVGIIVLALIGISWQYHHNRGRRWEND